MIFGVLKQVQLFGLVNEFKGIIPMDNSGLINDGSFLERYICEIIAFG